MEACAVAGSGEERPLCDPESESRSGGSWRRGSHVILVDRTGKKTPTSDWREGLKGGAKGGGGADWYRHWETEIRTQTDKITQATGRDS